MRNVTMADLARLANVSPSAISLALRNSPKISRETRERIVALAAEHGYFYNRQAADLRKQTSRTVAVCLHTITNPVFSSVLTAIERFFWTQGWMVMFGDCENDIEKQSAIIARSIENNVAGLVVSPASGTRTEDLEPFARRAPIVLAAREIDTDVIDRIRIDYGRGVELAVAHLAELGHRAIGWIGGGADTATARMGFASYRAALKCRGIIDRESWHMLCPPDRAGGHAAMNSLLQRAQEVTAVMCFSDQLAIGAMTALRERGLVPGHDISIVGFDDTEEARYTYPPLTTVRVDLPLLGESAGRLLLNRINEFDLGRQELHIPAQLVVRATSGPVGAGRAAERPA